MHFIQSLFCLKSNFQCALIYTFIRNIYFVSYLEGEEKETLGTLIEGFVQLDGELCERALSNPFIKHMDVEVSTPSWLLIRNLPIVSMFYIFPQYSKMARSLPIPSVKEHTTSSGTTGAEADDYTEGLC